MKRYAIKLPDGTYSKGGAWGGHPKYSVPFKKAKLWTGLGHVRNHLLQLDRNYPYPSGTEIVELVFSHTETPIMSVSDAKEESRLRKAKREAEYKLRYAKANLERAMREVAQAKDPVERARRELEKALTKAKELGIKNV